MMEKPHSEGEDQQRVENSREKLTRALWLCLLQTLYTSIQTNSFEIVLTTPTESTDDKYKPFSTDVDLLWKRNHLELQFVFIFSL